MKTKLKIVLVGPTFPDTLAVNFAEAFSFLGHRCTFHSVFSGAIGRSRVLRYLDSIRRRAITLTPNFEFGRRWRKAQIRKMLKENDPDIVLVCHDFFHPVEVEAVKEYGAKIALIFPDALVNFGRQYFMSSEYDALFFKDPFIVHRLQPVLSSPCYYLPECFNPRLHTPGESKSEYSCDITTACNLYAYRVAWLSKLARYDVKVWGNHSPDWLDCGPVTRMLQGCYLINEEKAAAFRTAKIALNTLHYGEIWGLNCRAFEICGSGGFQLLNWRPGLAQLFEDGNEVVSFRTEEALLSSIDFYLSNPKERDGIAARGHQRALREHTYDLRAQLVIDTLRGEASGFPMPEIEEPSTAPSARPEEGKGF